MARQMNVETRLGTLRKAIEKSSAFQETAEQISDELTAHYKGSRTPQGKQALAAARAAKKMAAAFSRVSQISL
jgi:hypothetical protein